MAAAESGGREEASRDETSRGEADWGGADRSEAGREATSEAIAVRRAEAAHRYEVSVDGALAGFAEYQERDGQILFTHTEVSDEFGGRGLGSVLAREALADAAARDAVIVPLCPFIDRYLRRHPDFTGRVARPEQD